MRKLSIYEKKAFDEKFNGCNKVAQYWLKNGKLTCNSNCKLKPHQALFNWLRKGTIYAFDPTHNGKTKMIWFDVDNHDSQNPGAEKIATTIYLKLVALGLKPELAKSSEHGFHICQTLKWPQSIKYCTTVQKRFLESLNLTCEVGPMNGKKLRPYFMGNDFKKPGQLIYPGEQIESLENLWRFYKPTFSEKERVFNEPLLFDISNYIPKGGNRDDCTFRMCRDMLNKNYSPTDILNKCSEIYDRGVVHDSKEKHMKDAERTLRSIRRLEFRIGKKKSFKEFWQSVQLGLLFEDLLAELSNYAKPLEAFPCQVREIASYYRKSNLKGYSRSSVSRKLLELAASKKLILVKKGYSTKVGTGKSSLYRLPENSD